MGNLSYDEKVTGLDNNSKSHMGSWLGSLITNIALFSSRFSCEYYLVGSSFEAFTQIEWLVFQKWASTFTFSFVLLYLLFYENDIFYFYLTISSFSKKAYGKRLFIFKNKVYLVCLNFGQKPVILGIIPTHKKPWKWNHC